MAVVLAVAGAAAAGARAAVRVTATPGPAQCAATRAHRNLAPIESFDPRPGAPRVFAMQFKQDLANVATYAAFHAKIECMLREYVVPRMARGRPNVVVFNEDIGLMTIATGSRGAPARAAFGRRGGPSCESQGAPCATLGALGAVTAAYAPQLAAYHARFPTLGSVSQAFVGATDTLVRSFMGAFSDLARRYGIYLVGSSDQAPFAQSRDPGDIAAFADPDGPRPDSVYVATSPAVYNQVFMWGPHDVRSDGPDVLRNVVASNRKVPLTPIENQLQFTPGPSTGPEAVANLRPYALPGTGARIGFATSLPAFVYGNPPPRTDPCSDTSLYYMRCLDRLGANLVLQDEANPGRWTGADGDGVEQWQPLSWMSSTSRTVTDPSVTFDYNVTAMMVGNLADLPFDGQTAITQRGLGGAGCHYVGNTAFVAGEDRPDLRTSAGAQPQFLAIAPWVVPDGARGTLRQVGAALAPGSGSPLENDYAETAIVADLPVPLDPGRSDCATGPARSPAGVVAPSTHACTSRRTVTIALPRRRRGRIVSVAVTVDGRPAGRRLAAAHRIRVSRIRVSLRHHAAGSTHVTVLIRYRHARPRRLRHTYRLCARRR